MHILYLHQHFVPPDGAGGTRPYEMARRFVKAGHRVTLITSTAFFPAKYKLDAPVTTLQVGGFEVRALRVPYSNRMPFVERLIAFARFAHGAAMEAARIDRPDVVFASSTPLTIAIPGIAAKLWHRRPMVFEVRDLWPELPIAMGALRSPVSRLAARALERIAYASSREIVALSPGMKEGVVRARVPPQRVSVIPNSCDLELFATPPEALELPFGRDEGPVVTYAGTLGAVNGVDYLVEIAASARRVAPELRFVIAGDGAMRGKVRQRALELGVLDRNLWMLPEIPKRTIPALLQRTAIACSLVIDLPALWNNSANKFFDALAAGRPIFVNYEGWQADLLRATGAGLVVPPRDAEAAASLLAAFTRDAARLRRASQAALELARTRFDRDRLAQDLLQVLERAARGQAPDSIAAARAPQRGR